ncbi:MAG: hypothetical protein QOF48_1491 [Verrucomicrobiota bacterium]
MAGRGNRRNHQMTVARVNTICDDCARMMQRLRVLLVVIVLGWSFGARAQIDPTHRELIQLGYNQPLEGRGPLAAYAFYYLNRPDFLQHSNLTLRLAIAPVYLDSELGIRGALGPHTDLGVGLAGGGFADSYSEVRRGKYEREESFLGHGGMISSSIYHLFNPDARMPLHGVVRGGVHFSTYTEDSVTADTFEVPDDQVSYRVRAGLRLGGVEPVMMPELAGELSAWYDGDFRGNPTRYGFSNDRGINNASHLFWARALLNYTTRTWKHNFGINLTAGTGLGVDRFSAYRVGGTLPLGAEFPLSLPGYYHHELSARTFALLNGSYNLPLDRRQLFLVNFTGSTAWLDYLPGLEQPGRWNSGVGGGFVFRSPTDSWLVGIGYGYGFNAIRGDQRGAQSLLFLLQFDWGRTRHRLFNPDDGIGRTRGLDTILRNIFR